jgi:hypothetical protein
MQLILPSGFVVPTGSNLDHRKKYMKDPDAIETYREIVQVLFEFGMREIVLPDR